MSRISSHARGRARVFGRAGRVLLAWCALTVTAAAPADEAGVRVPPFERVQLANGTVLLLMERHDVPLIAFQALIRGGAMVDPEDRSGMASLLAAMLEKGAGERDAFGFADAVAAVGGSIQARARTESLVVSGSFLARDQALMVELLADMLQRPLLERDQFEALRARHIDFIRAAKESSLGSLAAVYGARALFGSHGYGRPVIGSEAGLAAIAHEELERHYQAQVGADRLILAVAGDFQTAHMKAALERAFAGWRKAGAPLAPAPPPARERARRVLLVDAPESTQSYFWAGNVSVPRSYAPRPPLDVANVLFGGRFTSMLNSELRVRTGLSYGARSQLERFAQGGLWQMSSFTQTDKTLEAIDLALTTLDRLHATQFEPDVLQSGKAYVQGQYPLALETAAQWAAQLADLEFYGLERRDIDEYGAALARVSAADTSRAIDAAIPRSDAVVLVVIGQADEIREGLRKYGPVTEMALSAPTFAAP